MFNKLLERQFSKYLEGQKKISPQLHDFLKAVSDSYDHYEKDRNILKRTMELNSSQLTEVNNKLRDEAEENALVFKKLRESLLMLRDEENDSIEILEIEDLKLLSIAELLKNESRRRKEAESKLKEYLRDLEKINKELDQFTYVVSHDLKAPLRAISSLTTFLEEDLYSTMSEESKQNFSLLQKRVVRMENFINGLLKFSKATKSSHLEMIDSRNLVIEILEWIDLPEHVTINITGNFPILNTEKIKFEQVFANLISNAIKYNNKERGIIEIGCTDFEEWCQFYVQDNGSGIEKQFQEKIFELFQTLESRDLFENTGIGLAIVKKIIEDQGGKIWVESKPDEGAKFIFNYPKIKLIDLVKNH
ncbi:MAG: ATP-binding protein [Bacteroidia bacterium]